MNAILNYLLEASIGLCLFLLTYQLLLRQETNFRLNRIFLLIAVVASVTFPLVKLSTPDSPVPSLNFSVEMPDELSSYSPEDQSNPAPVFTFNALWKTVFIFYSAGFLAFLLVFLKRLFNMITIVKKSPKLQFTDHHIIELKSNQTPFSFFNYIFVSNSSPLSEKEKHQIIEHEKIHARLYHSIDIIVLNILGIVFWFNPLIQVYKKIFVQLHEFEADARAVEKHDVDEYCSLVARVALYSADFRLANHFSNSLTLKRIEMMRTLKQKIKSWKVLAASAIIPVFFFVAACQDQAETPYQEIEVVERPIEYPANVQDVLNKLKKESPNDKFVVIPPNLGKVEPDASSVTIDDGATKYVADAITVITTDTKDSNGNPSRYMILQYRSGNKEAFKEEEVIEEVPGREKIFLTVEDQPSYEGGMENITKILNQNIRYPQKARSENVEGTVYVRFTVNPDGSIGDTRVIKGISQECDQEALRLVQLLNKWKPGMQSGKAVPVRYVLPVKFKL